MFSLLGVIFNSPILNLTTIPECSILYRNSLTSGINFSVSHGYNTLPNKILSIRVTEDTAKLLNLLILLLFTITKNIIYKKINPSYLLIPVIIIFTIYKISNIIISVLS